MMHGLGKKNYSEEGNLSLNLGRGERKKKENKRNKPLWEGILPHLLLRKEVWRNRSRLSSGSPGGPPGGRLGGLCPGTTHYWAKQPCISASMPHWGRRGTCTSHTTACASMSLYLLGSWGTERWQKGTLWLSPRFSFSLCFLIAAEPREKRVRWRALRHYLHCPHTRCVHLSDPSALKNCQLHKEEGINISGEFGIGELGRRKEREGRMNWETEARVVHESMWCQANTGITRLVQESWVGGGRMKELSIQISFSLYTGPLILSRLHLTRRAIAFQNHLQLSERQFFLLTPLWKALNQTSPYEPHDHPQHTTISLQYQWSALARQLILAFAKWTLFSHFTETYAPVISYHLSKTHLTLGSGCNFHKSV